MIIQRVNSSDLDQGHNVWICYFDILDHLLLMRIKFLKHNNKKQLI